MPNSEDYILDFKAEEKKTQATVFDVEDIESDSNTMSASEADSNESNISTPPLLCKLRKARVMIKKLPRHVLEKHKMINKSKTSNSSSTSSAKPSRVSKRKGNKTVPGLYLSLHVNKPLNEVLNKKKRRQRTCLKTAARPGKIIKPKLVAHNKKSLRLAEKPKEVPIKTEDTGSSSARTTGLRKTNKKHQFPKYLGGSIVNISPNKTTASSSTRPRLSLLEKIAATRRINREEKLKRFVTSARLPNCPDVVITKYDLPTVTTTQFNPENSLLYNPDVVPSLQTYQSYAGAKMLNTPQHNITVQVPASYTTPPTNAFPTRIMSAPRQLPILVNAGSIVPNQPTQMSSSSSLRQNSYRTQKINDTIRGDSSKALVINQPNSRKEQKKSKKQKERDNYSESDTETCSQAESEYQDIPDTEQRQSSKEPQVIKRIIYHTKAVQTKFTCNGTICGLVDSDEFNLNCFYCYEIFPLHKWREFKEHIKIVHHVEEQSIESEEDEETENLESQSQLTTNSETQTINLKAKQPLPNKQMFVAKPIESAAAKEGAYKKLPLEPRLVAQREQEFKKISSQPTPTAVNKSPAKKTSSQQLNLSQQSNTSSRGNVSIDLCDDIVSLDSDLDNDELQLVDDIAENVVKEKDTSKNSNLNKSVSFIDEVAKLIPPHITIKKITNPCSIEKANLNKTTSPQKSISLVKPFINTTTTETIKTTDTSLDEPFIKVPSNSNIQRVIKYIPKPTTEQSTGVETTKPRYFVVKKIVKPATKTPSLNVTKAMLFSKKPKTDDDDDMPSNDENEDAVPKPTNGCGILFGLTNPMVVIEFLLKLKSFPELWRPQEKKNSVNYDESIKKLCFHLNSRFELNIQDFEMRLSIQRVKDWYCRMLKKIHEHNKNCNNEEPYKHKFPLYFKILNQFLTSDVNFTNNLLLSSRFKSDTNMNKYPKWMVYKTGSPQTPKTTATTINLDEKKEEINNKEVNNSRSLLKTNNNPAVSQETVVAEPAAAAPITTTTTTAIDTSPPSAEPPPPPVADTETNAENNTDDNLIEFDADILYEDESSDEEVLEFFDETKRSNEKLNKNGEPRKKYTKTYSGSHECDVCHKFYKRTCDLRRHRIHHFPPQFECSVCTQKFFFKHWAEKCNHLRKRKYAIMNKTETGGKDGVETVIPRKWPKKIFRFKLICEICGASYRQIGSLNCHKRDKHLNQRLNCVVCNFTALTNYRIVQHQKKRHIVEPGTVEELAKKSRARTDTKTPFSVEARQEFDWRREMRKKLQPGEKFFACCKCRIIFNSRKEKVLHNKLEHPIKETSVVCLLCLPTKFLLSNSNSARRHYTDIHKVPWDEIDALVKRTKPVFNILSKEEIELLNASQNWKELLEELIKDRELEPLEKIKTQIDEEAVQAVQNLPVFNTEPDIEVNKLDVESEETKEEANVYIEGQQQQAEEEVEVAKDDENVYVDNIEETKEENVYVDGIIDHDYNNEEMVYYNEHDYSEEQHGETMQHYENYEEGQEGEELQNEQNNDHNNQLYENPQPNVIVEGVNAPIAYNIECTEDVIVDQQSEDNEQQYLQSIMGDLVEGELVDGQLVEECIVVEECIEDVIDEEEEYF